MRRIFSWGSALIIIVVIAVWMGTGVFVEGGLGPGNGERPVTSLLDADGQARANEEGEQNPSEQDSAEQDSAEQNPSEHEPEEPDPALTIAERNALTRGANAPARSVRTRRFSVQMMPLEVTLRGRTQAKSIVMAVAETSAIVLEVAVDKGQKVSEGDLLCRLDPGPRAAALAQAEAALAQAQLNFDNNATLRARGVAPENTAAANEVALKSAEAALDLAKTEIDRTSIFARVSGVVQDPLATVGSLLASGTPCATIVELDPMLFVGSVPEARIGLARTGLDATIETISGITVEGTVSYLSTTAEPSTRSFDIEIELPNADGKVLDGLTATALVNLGVAPAHLIPQSALTLDDKGVLGLRAVEDDRVVFYPVTIAGDTRDGVWLLGLPGAIDVITVGQEFVTAGQIVDAGEAPQGTSS
ncbi:MAG: efflux RND transporter periplasmic adaptor subunit [Alphaproteobacteria bacterium]|nr:efflux RND transporter periplasmic adaptor subunit [Alphaproteobacteria bacterium]